MNIGVKRTGYRYYSTINHGLCFVINVYLVLFTPTDPLGNHNNTANIQIIF